MTFGIVVVVQTAGYVTMLLIGYLMGRMEGRRARAAAAPPKPICMCKHNFGSHKGGYECTVDHLDEYGSKLSSCACLLYVGPDPLASGLWHPPSAKDKP